MCPPPPFSKPSETQPPKQLQRGDKPSSSSSPKTPPPYEKKEHADPSLPTLLQPRTKRNSIPTPRSLSPSLPPSLSQRSPPALAHAHETTQHADPSLPTLAGAAPSSDSSTCVYHSVMAPWSSVLLMPPAGEMRFRSG